LVGTYYLYYNLYYLENAATNQKSTTKPRKANVEFKYVFKIKIGLSVLIEKFILLFSEFNSHRTTTEVETFLNAKYRNRATARMNATDFQKY